MPASVNSSDPPPHCGGGQGGGNETVVHGLQSIPAWEDHRWTALPHLSGTMRADVCVIGLGGSGLAAPRHCTGNSQRDSGTHDYQMPST